MAGGRPGNLGMWKLITASRSPTLSSSSAGDAVAASERSATAAAAGRAPLPAPCAGSGQLALTRTRNRAVMLVRMASLTGLRFTISLKWKVKNVKEGGQEGTMDGPGTALPAPVPPAHRSITSRRYPPPCIRLHIVLPGFVYLTDTAVRFLTYSPWAECWLSRPELQHGARVAGRPLEFSRLNLS